MKYGYFDNENREYVITNPATPAPWVNYLGSPEYGATKTIGDYVITDRIHDFLNQPDTALTLIVDNTKHLLHLLEQNTLDYAIIEGFCSNRCKNRFGSQLYRREPFVGICPKDHPFAGREVSVE